MDIMDTREQPDDIIHCFVCSKPLNFENEAAHYESDATHIAWVEAHEVAEVVDASLPLWDAAQDIFEAIEDGEGDVDFAVLRFNRLYTPTWRERLAPKIEAYKEAEEKWLREEEEESV